MIRLLTRRGVQVFLLLALLVASTLMSASDVKPLKRLEYLTFDTFNAIKPRVSNQDVVIVDIDESSLSRLGQWPWPRDVLAKLVDRLSDLGAASVAFDMAFAEADRTTPSQIAGRLEGVPGTDVVRRELYKLPDNDRIFADAIARNGRVVTGFVWTNEPSALSAPEIKRSFVVLGDAKKHYLDNALAAEYLATTLPVIEQAAAGNGSFATSTEVDGIVRKVPMIIRHTHAGSEDPKFYPSLSLEAARVYLSEKNSPTIARTQLRDGNILDAFSTAYSIRIGAKTIPIDEKGQVYVYYAQHRSERYVPAWSVIAGQVAPETIKGKAILIGASAQGLKDLRSSPLDLFVPGVEMHANIIEQILNNEFLVRPAFSKEVEAWFIFLTGLLVILLVPFVNLFVLLGVVLALVAGAFTVSWKAFAGPGILIEPIYPSLAVIVMFVVSALLSYLKAEYERAEIRDAFGLYISPAFMDELTKNPEKLSLGGEIRPLTVMFTDIRNFTTIAEGMSPQVLINTMNEFLTPMSDEVMKARGTIDKYMGDAMMAFWNAPLDVDNHEKQALGAALAMRRVLEPVNASLKAKAEADGRPFYPLHCGIGINTGPVAVGNMGSRQRFAYSALGDAVNLASRLEGQTKAYGVNILIGETTALGARDFALMEMDLIRVKGKNEPVRIYTVLGDAVMAASDTFQNWSRAHQDFLVAYRASDFDRCLVQISVCRSLDTQKSLSDYYAVFEDRVAEFKKTPPPQGWDGVYTAVSK